MPHSVLIAAYVGWPAGVVVLRLVMRVRTRCLVVTGLGVLAGLAIATTAMPARAAVPLGLLVGPVIAVGGCLATARGVTFTFDQDATYRKYAGTIPLGDRLVEALSALVAVVGAVALLWE
ncbi:hypothetical protein ACWEOO_14575 [Kribbella sp. NPDC004138]